MVEQRYRKPQVIGSSPIDGSKPNTTYIDMQSRLSKAAERKTKKQLYLSLIGIVIVVFVLVKFGIPALVNFSLFLSNFHGQQSQSTTPATNQIIAQPILTQDFTATNSATITVNGTAAAQEKVQLYVNDDLVDTISTKDDGTFSFKNITLTQQQNTLKARAKKDDKVSEFSDSLIISYIQKAPSLSVDSPSDGQSFSHDQSTVVVKGKTDPDIKVTVNDFWAIVDNNGNYSYSLHLQNGDNQIHVVATDPAGNKTEKQITVKYSQ